MPHADHHAEHHAKRHRKHDAKDSAERHRKRPPNPKTDGRPAAIPSASQSASGPTVLVSSTYAGHLCLEAARFITRGSYVAPIRNTFEFYKMVVGNGEREYAVIVVDVIYEEDMPWVTRFLTGFRDIEDAYARILRGSRSIPWTEGKCAFARTDAVQPGETKLGQLAHILRGPGDRNRPNARYECEGGIMHLRALRDILPGEEILLHSFKVPRPASAATLLFVLKGHEGKMLPPSKWADMTPQEYIDYALGHACSMYRA